jgi:hypothetical protein
MILRSPAVAGSFYPAQPDALHRMVWTYLEGAQATPVAAKAIVAPHAGYVYSGPIAGTSFGSVAHLADQLTRIVLLGPSHRMAFAGMAVPSATGLLTPLGTVAVDVEAVQRILTLPQVRVFDKPYDGEHALEVELPFLQTLFPRASVVPLLLGDVGADAVERVLDELWGGPETLIVISSDLSHFHDYDAARALDLGTSQAIETAALPKINNAGACGHRALAGLMRRAAKLDLRATTRDLRNSGDTRGSRDSVVGYGAYTFEYAHEATLSQLHRKQLLDAAYAAMRHIGEKGRPPEVAVPTFPLPLRALRNTFVTLEIDGQVRGCVGTLTPISPLIADVVANTYKAAMLDRRFKPMTAEELRQAKVTVSILSHMRPLPFASEAELLDRMRPEIDGLVLRDGAQQALLLPKVWDALPQPEAFLAALKRKAGLPLTSLSSTAKMFRFTAETFAS